MWHHWGRVRAWSSAAPPAARRRRAEGRAPPAWPRSWRRAAACPTRAERSWRRAQPRITAPSGAPARGCTGDTRDSRHSAPVRAPRSIAAPRLRPEPCALRLTRRAWGTRGTLREKTTDRISTCKWTSFVQRAPYGDESRVRFQWWPGCVREVRLHVQVASASVWRRGGTLTGRARTACSARTRYPLTTISIAIAVLRYYI